MKRHRETHWRIAAAATVLTPIVFTGYVTFVLWLRPYPIRTGPIEGSVLPILALVALAEVGVLVAGGWLRGLRVAPSIAIGSVLLWPWVFPGMPFGSNASASYVFLLFAVVLLVTVSELLARNVDDVKRLAATRTGEYAAAAGTGHFLVGFALTVYARRLYWAAGLGSLLLVGSAIGSFVLGAAAVLLWTDRRLVSPGLAVAGWAGWGVFGTWQLRRTLPRGPSSGIEFTAVEPYPEYLFTWVVLAVVVGLLALCEGELRRIREAA